MKSGFQEIWEELRREGKQVTKYPYDVVVSFVFRYYPKDKARNEVNVLDLGCGTGNHLWFLAKEGFNAYGIEGSVTAVQIAKKVLKEFGVKAHIEIGDFTQPLPYESEFFDLVIDRSALSYVSYESAQKIIEEIHRVLKLGGYFLFTPYSISHSSFSKESDGTGNVFINVTKGNLKGTGYVCFYDEKRIRDLFDSNKWEIIVLAENTSYDRVTGNIDASWKVVVRKKGGSFYGNWR